MREGATKSNTTCYKALDDPKSHRLVRISPAQDGGYIKCELIATTLPEPTTKAAIPYRALSYCWGTAVGNHSITLVDEEASLAALIDVTDNLYAFLSARLAMQDHTWIFIDALCINQKDIQERSRQVRMLGNIYRNAHNVTIWLGDRETDIGKLLALLKTGRQEGRKFYNLRTMNDADQKLLIFQGLVKLVNHPYWTRLWIVPEVTLARSIDIQFAQTVVEYGIVHQTLDKAYIDVRSDGVVSKNPPKRYIICYGKSLPTCIRVQVVCFTMLHNTYI